MKKMIALTLCAMLTLSVCACGSDQKNTDTAIGAEDTTSATSNETIIGEDPATWGPDDGEDTTIDTLEGGDDTFVGMPNPFVEGTLEECKKRAGFDFTVPEHYGDYSERTILAIEGYLIEAIYADKDPLEGLDDDALNKLDWETIDFDSDSLMIRKALSLNTAEVTGDYNTYEETNTLTVNDREVTTYGNNGTISDAVWNDGTYTYAVISSKGLTATELTELLAEIP